MEGIKIWICLNDTNKNNIKILKNGNSKNVHLPNASRSYIGQARKMFQMRYEFSGGKRIKITLASED